MSSTDAPLVHRALICVIDDDRSVRKALVGLITSMGYNCEGHASAEAWLETGRVGSAGCIVTDIHMPGLDGFGLKRRLISLGWRTPVVMITGHGEVHLEQQALEAGAFAFFRKPLRANSLAESLARALESS